jgi:4-diphosphocytidyl-2-C-methyl-D-erythritol kinase
LIRALPARAKLNLELKVRGRREDGHHEVETVLQAISLHDLVELEPGPQTELGVSGLPAPAGAENLVLKALAAAGVNARIQLTKRIPAGAGLGGASSDAAAVLRLLGKPDLAAGLGADVPFFLRGGTAQATGRGDQLQPVPDRPGWFAIAWPGFEVSTAAVYQAWDETGGDGRNELFRAACRVEPRLSEFAGRLGAGWLMTGSGSAFFRECRDEDDAARAVAGRQTWTAVARAVPAWG